jgi:hypothetical protein
MPFLVFDQDGRRILLFTQTSPDTPQIWKIFYKIDDNEPVRIATGLADQSIECSPTAWQDENGWHLSFIGMDNDLIFRLYLMEGATLETLAPPTLIRTNRTGFVYKDRIAIGEIQDLVVVHDNNGDHDIEISGAFIYRVSYRADNPNKLLISGEWINELQDPFTLEYDLSDDSQHYIECNGKGAYKCTIYGDEILYAQRTGEKFESRQIAQSNKYNRIGCKTAHRRKSDFQSALFTESKERCGCRNSSYSTSSDNAQTTQNYSTQTSRESCIECVEKHIGSAMILLAEIQNGYSYRVRLIGHLHEAEDESRSWTTLHNMIRDARKQFQKNSTPPNWDLISNEILRIINSLEV